MKSIKLFKVFGIPLELHSSFIWLILIGAVFLALFAPDSLLQSAVFFAMLFASVFLHELSHSIVALSKGVKVQKIILLPIRRVALTKNNAKKPLD